MNYTNLLTFKCKSEKVFHFVIGQDFPQPSSENTPAKSEELIEEIQGKSNQNLVLKKLVIKD